jgi:cubilin
VDECARFATTPGHGCENGATCQNLPGTYRCHCAPDFYGIHCGESSNSCGSGSAEELCGHGRCLDQASGGYTCLCSQGWTTAPGSPACIQDVDECLLGPPPCSREPRVSCVNVPGTFYCGACPAGYTGDGETVAPPPSTLRLPLCRC